MNRAINPEDAHRALHALEAIEKHLVQIETVIQRATRTCVNCDHFNIDEQCKLATPPVRPPARVIAYGCDGYKEGIPF